MSAAADALMGIFGFKRVEGEGMKTDRELLELAARAAEYDMVMDGDYYFSRGTSNEWNPLADDGDALRLAADLSFDVLINADRVEIYTGECACDFIAHKVTGGDKRRATRCAIVRAAAAIGEASK